MGDFFDSTDTPGYMPKLVMAIGVQYHGCSLFVRKPISLETVITILKTPVDGILVDHRICLLANDTSQLALENLIDECEGHRDMLCMPVKTIASVKLAAAACIRSNPNRNSTNVATDILLYGAVLSTSGDSETTRIGILQTALSLVGLTAHRGQLSQVMDRDCRLYAAQYDGQAHCTYGGRYSKFHLALELTESEADAFVEQVRRERVGVVAFRILHTNPNPTQLAKESARTPAILQIRISISIIGNRPSTYLEYPKSVALRMQTLFEDNISAIQQYLGHRRRMIFQCYYSEPCPGTDDTGYHLGRLRVSTRNGGLSFDCQQSFSNTLEEWEDELNELEPVQWHS